METKKNNSKVSVKKVLCVLGIMFVLIGVLYVILHPYRLYTDYSGSVYGGSYIKFIGDYESTKYQLEKIGYSMPYSDEESNYFVLAEYFSKKFNYIYYLGSVVSDDKLGLTVNIITNGEDYPSTYIDIEGDSESYDKGGGFVLVFPTKALSSADIDVNYLFRKKRSCSNNGKPVLYLYPENDNTDVQVSLDLTGQEFTSIYPFFNNGENSWSVSANSNGDLKIGNKTYNYLYWESEDFNNRSFEPEYCIRGTDIAEFLESKLLELGLTEHEANEFIVFWLPQMEVNKYNLISFNNNEYIEDTKINTVPKADTAIRVFMTWKSCDEYIDIESPVISTPERNGFTIVEWGGTCLN